MKKIEIKGIVEYQEANLEEIKEIVLQGELTTKDTQLAIARALEVRKQMTDAKEKFMTEVKEQLANFDEKFNELNDFIEEDIKNKALLLAQETDSWTESTWKKIKEVDSETGEVQVEEKTTIKRSTELPKGLRYTRPKEALEYVESEIKDDKFYKKTLKKTEVKKAIEAGELDVNMVTKKVMKPGSISIVAEEFIAGAKENE